MSVIESFSGFVVIIFHYPKFSEARKCNFSSKLYLLEHFVLWPSTCTRVFIFKTFCLCGWRQKPDRPVMQKCAVICKNFAQQTFPFFNTCSFCSVKFSYDSFQILPNLSQDTLLILFLASETWSSNVFQKAFQLWYMSLSEIMFFGK